MTRRPPPVLDPAAEAYAAPVKPLSKHVEATKDLLAWMRNMGIRCDAIEVGTDGVRIHNLSDDYPRKQPREAKRGDPEFDD